MTTTLLAVDDSKTMRRVLEITFAGERQFKLTLAESAEDALSKLNALAPQLVLVDITLPGQNGYDLCRQIKSQAPGTAVLLLSSKHQPFDSARGSAVGADDFIDKPFDTQQLIDKVSQVCQAMPTLHPETAPALQRSAPPPAARVSTMPEARSPSLRPDSRGPEVRGIASHAPPKPKAASVAPASSASRAAAIGPEFTRDLEKLGLTREQINGVVALSREVVERVVWEVVPVLAETLIKEEIQRLTAE